MDAITALPASVRHTLRTLKINCDRSLGAPRNNESFRPDMTRTRIFSEFHNLNSLTLMIEDEFYTCDIMRGLLSHFSKGTLRYLCFEVADWTYDIVRDCFSMHKAVQEGKVMG